MFLTFCNLPDMTVKDLVVRLSCYKRNVIRDVKTPLDRDCSKLSSSQSSHVDIPTHHRAGID